MFEPMTIWAKVWAVAADPLGLWKIGGIRPWTDGPVMADNSVQAMVEDLLRQHGIDPRDAAKGGDCLWLHSTSWNPDGPRQFDTYLVAVACEELALTAFPDAEPVTPDLLDEETGRGRPPTHGPVEEPGPVRELDTLFHGLGHLKEQLRKNATTARAVGEWRGGLWRVQLEPYEETLAGMYSVPHQAA